MGSTRHGDWAMRMRFWGVNTREMEKSARQRLSARASHPKARSHNPITAPELARQTFHVGPINLWRALSKLGRFAFSPSADPQRHRISRVMRFAKVKEETAQRAGDT